MPEHFSPQPQGREMTLLDHVEFAFSGRSRQIILQRDNYQCIECGTTENLEAAHYDHTRNGGYDNPNNGRTLCTRHHLEDHIRNAGHNGLSYEANEWAINRIKERLGEKEIYLAK